MRLSGEVISCCMRMRRLPCTVAGEEIILLGDLRRTYGSAALECSGTARCRQGGWRSLLIGRVDMEPEMAREAGRTECWLFCLPTLMHACMLNRERAELGYTILVAGHFLTLAQQK